MGSVISGLKRPCNLREIGIDAFATNKATGLIWLRQFAEGARADGTVMRAIERSGLRGASDSR